MSQKKKIAIAIDGPSGSGKSTAAKIIARKLNIMYVDTGALYRTIGLYVRDHQVDKHDNPAIIGMLPQIRIEVRYENGAQVVYLNGENPGEKIREPEIAMYASAVSAIPEVRTFLLETQKQIARTNSVVMDGRDIGTVILPQADLKIFLNASNQTRAERRCEELKAKGIETSVEEVLEYLEKRDANDRERDIAPCVPADDAVLLDNSRWTAEETADVIISLMEKRLKKRNRGRFFALVRGLLLGPVMLLNHIRIHNHDNEPTADKGSYLMCCNHFSWYDPIVLSATLRWQQPRFMAKEELFKIPVLGWLLKGFGAYPVNRGANDVSAVKRVINTLKMGDVVGIFPQGHRYKGEDPRTTPAKQGAALIAARTHVTILPVGFKVKDYTPKLFRRTDVYVGKPITWTELSEHGGRDKDYEQMTQYIFDRICDLTEGKDV